MHANPTSAAVKEPGNIAGVAAAVGLAIVFHPLLPLILAGAALVEAGYLMILPRSRWYQKKVLERFQTGADKRSANLKSRLGSSIRPELQSRLERLEQSRLAIGRQMSDQAAWFVELLNKLDYLLDKFAEFAAKETEFRGYLRDVLSEALREEQLASNPSGGYVSSHSAHGKWAEEPPANPAEAWVRAIVGKVQGHYDSEIADLNRQRTADSEDLTTNAVLDKRIDVIERRREYVVQIGKIAVNLNHQMELMEDTFGLISDEIRARPPEQVLADVDEAIGRTDSLTELLQGLTPAAAAGEQSVVSEQA